MGLDLKNENIKLLKTKIGNVAICDLYYVKMDIDLNNIHYQEEEVSDVKLATVEEIKKMIEDGSFHIGHGKTFLSILELINKQVQFWYFFLLIISY